MNYFFLSVVLNFLILNLYAQTYQFQILNNNFFINKQKSNQDSSLNTLNFDFRGSLLPVIEVLKINKKYGLGVGVSINNSKYNQENVIENLDYYHKIYSQRNYSNLGINAQLFDIINFNKYQIFNAIKFNANITTSFRVNQQIYEYNKSNNVLVDSTVSSNIYPNIFLIGLGYQVKQVRHFNNFLLIASVELSLQAKSYFPNAYQKITTTQNGITSNEKYFYKGFNFLPYFLPQIGIGYEFSNSKKKIKRLSKYSEEK
jgi:hypothetical protein